MDDRCPKPLKHIYSQDEVTQPIVRWRSPGTDLHRAIHIAVQRGVTPEGVFPQHLFWRRDGMSTDCYQEIMTTPGGLLVARALDLIHGGHGITQLVFGVDVQELKVLKYGSGVIVADWRHGIWRIGVIHYRWAPRIIEPINWQHQPSIRYMQDLIVLYSRKRVVQSAGPRYTGPFLIR